MLKSRKSPYKPFLLGSDDIHPPLDVPWQMWSTSSNPYEQGLVQFEFTPEGLRIGWMYTEKLVIRWHEMAFIAAHPPRLNEEIQHIREGAERAGYLYGLAKALKQFESKMPLIEAPSLRKETV